ncbi:putative oxidoreductase [Escovopsis weberi]|uniref:Putative oxidoreductase n=1 Tax=Escovopsis weberi TaxID=150374 RepID=A0A0M8MUS2_ESCWE|nr:putative oxidoreductase [Escovopsis weberi]
MSLQDRVVVITGASKGIGRACAERLSKEGARIVLNYNSDSAAADAAVEALGGPERNVAVQADASTMAGVDAIVAAAVAKFGRIDAIMPNAGLMLMRDVESTSEDDFDKMFNINVKCPYFLVQKAIPHMPRGSKVIFVSTGICHASTVTPDYTLYAATKGAIEQMTRTMGRGLAAKGITVNAIGPGPTGTELFYRGKPDFVVEAIKKMNPFNKIGEPEDIANSVYFLCSQDSSWINGQVLLANGGSMV